ncbi:MAG: diguanylate cyclase [Isosphaeraceae bacterium]|jgi:diguanylate cyclase (GGDEF)-like protein/PAS domain S-box-containing protein|nr:MAG: diguanylate cyclase [Isosphaeraceae bacterium]
MSRSDSAASSLGPPDDSSRIPPLDADSLLRLLDQLAEGLCIVDPGGRIIHWSSGAESITGYTAEQLTGRSCHHSPLCDTACGAGDLSACPILRALNAGTPSVARLFRHHQTGRTLVLEVQILPLLDSHGRGQGAVAFFRDTSATAELEMACGHLRALAETDPLTGLANRRHLDAAIQGQLDQLDHCPGYRFSVILADLDHFKQINDTWGHGIGDQVLQSFARALKAQCRPGDTVGRFGGEEFLIILPGVRLADALEIAERMRAITPLTAPPGLLALRPSASFGVAEARPTDTPGHLLRRVDAALYRAKRQGRQRVEPQSGEQSPPAA